MDSFYADVVVPVPPEAIPEATQKQPGGVGLYKREFRSAARLAQKEKVRLALTDLSESGALRSRSRAERRGAAAE
jgi:hypothetical protein